MRSSYNHFYKLQIQYITGLKTAPEKRGNFFGTGYWILGFLELALTG